MSFRKVVLTCLVLILLQSLLVSSKGRGSGNSKGHKRGRGGRPSHAERARHGFSEEKYQKMKDKAIEVKSKLCTKHDIPEDRCPKDEYFGSSLIYTELLKRFPKSRRKRATGIDFITQPDFKWPATLIKYRITGLGALDVSYVKQAFDFWSSRTCLTFLEVPSVEDILVSWTTLPCSTAVGYDPNAMPHVIDVNPTLCLKECGVMMGLIAKALGFYDEQTRADRGAHVTLVDEHITMPGPFQIMTPSDTYNTPYDYTSILHAHAYTATDTVGTKTIVTTNALFGATLGQALMPSFFDVKAVNAAYCSTPCPVPTCVNGYRNPGDCTRCLCPDGYSGILCETVAVNGGACTPASNLINVPTTGTFTISSGNYPNGNYPQGRGQSCHYILKAPLNCQVKAWFTYGPDVRMEDGHCLHWVEIKYESDKDLPGPRFCNNETPLSLAGVSELVSLNDEMVVIFNAEMPYCLGGVYPSSGSTRTGFELSYSLVDPNCVSGSPNDCLTANPCQNGGLCLWDGTTATCTCTTGFSGADCGTVDLCYNRFCQHGGTCVPADGSCDCAVGWKGTDCDTQDWCSPDPCLNSGVCADQTTFYTCACATGYYGANCGSSDCDTDPCEMGVCTPIDGGYTCSCDPNWTGTDCDEEDYCEMNSDDCSSQGTCTNYPSLMDFQCSCNDNFYGAKCELSACPCVNGGTCVNELSSMVCSCPDGFYGSTCELVVGSDFCVSSPCQNGATCNNGASGWICTCPSGFHGVNCEFADNCQPTNPCANSAPCHPEENSYFCACPSGYYGQDCEFNFCSTSPCLYGTCANLDNGYSCTCDTNWWGDQCDKYDYCLLLNSCQNGGACHNIENGGIVCECPAGFYGTNCELTACPCLNSGTCVFTMSTNLCSCPSGYYGSICDIATGGDLCGAIPNPCKNGGACSNDGDDYACSCLPGFAGRNCQDFDYCTAGYCLNGGTCSSDPVSGATCACTGGYYGDVCEYPCPCYNGGQCAHMGNYFTCTCASGYTGDRCQDGCGVGQTVMESFVPTTGCSETAGGCGTQLGDFCPSGHNTELRKYRRRCNICPYVGPKYMTEKVFILQADGTFKRVIRYPLCCYSFRGVNIRFSIRKRLCRRPLAAGIYPTPFNRAAFCKTGRPFPVG